MKEWSCVGILHYKAVDCKRVPTRLQRTVVSIHICRNQTSYFSQSCFIFVMMLNNIHIMMLTNTHIQLLESACPSVRSSVTKKPRIMDTCTRVKDHGYMHHSYLHHTHMHQDQGSYVYASWIFAYMHQVLGSRIIDISIIVIVSDHIYMHHTHASYLHTSGSRIKYICIIQTHNKINLS